VELASISRERIAEIRARIELYNLQRLYMANRGVWEAIDSAGPACGIQTTEVQLDRYLEPLAGFLDQAQSRAAASAR
jgi:hypothetical protein